MKLKHIWSVLCQDSTLNQDDNLITINKVLEELSINLAPLPNSKDKPIPKIINLPINYEITSLWLKEPGNISVKAEIKYALFNAERSKAMETLQNVEIPDNSKRFRSRMKISGMPISGEGDYEFKVYIKAEDDKDFRLVSEIPFEVKIKMEKPLITK